MLQDEKNTFNALNELEESIFNIFNRINKDNKLIILRNMQSIKKTLNKSFLHLDGK